MSSKEKVCVTGAGGFLASWLVKLLLSKGYMVNGTVRDTYDEKNSHLRKLENSAENLRLFKADLSDYAGLCDAIEGCSGVFHVASPLPPRGQLVSKEELVEPAVGGTINVLKACSEAKVNKVVFVSSSGAVVLKPDWPKDQLMDEESWSDLELSEQIKLWYFFSKTSAEKEAWEYAKRTNLNLVTVFPALINVRPCFYFNEVLNFCSTNEFGPKIGVFMPFTPPFWGPIKKQLILLLSFLLDPTFHSWLPQFFPNIFLI